jgi:O-antigen/teichoic acid export membrane protein
MSTLTKNTLFLTVASVGQKAIAFLYFALIANRLGDESLLGAYFLALALTTTIGVLDDLGMTSVVIRETAKAPQEVKRLLKNVLGWKVCAMPFTALLGVFLPSVLGFSPEATLLVWYAIGVMLADTLSVTFYGALRGLQVVKYEALGIFVGQSLTTVFGASALFFAPFDLRLLIVALLVGSVWNALFSAVHVARRLGASSLVPSWTMGLAPLKMGSMFFLAALFVKIYSYIDSFTIKMVLGQGAVGVYSVAYKLAYAFQFLPLAFVGALYPTMSAQLHDRVKLKETFLQSEWYLALLAAPVVFGLAALAPEVIGLVYGDRYLEAAPALQALLVGLWFIFMDFPVGSLLNASGMQHKKTAVMGVAMVINFIANILLVRAFGIVGAGYSAILTFVALFGAGFYFVRSVVSVSFREWWGSVQGVTFAGLGMFASVLVLKEVFGMVHPLGWLLAIPCGAAIFFALGWWFGGIRKDHVQSVKHLLRRK